MQRHLVKLREFVSNLPINRKGWLVITTPVIALVLSTGIFAYTRWNANLADASVKHTLEVEKEIYQIVFAMLQAQSAARDHAASDGRVRAQYQKAKKRLPDLIEKVENGTLDNPSQIERVKTLKLLIGKMLARADAVLTQPAEEPSASALSYRQWVDQNKLQIDEAARVLGGMLVEEERLLAIRIARRQQAGHISSVAIVVSLTLGLLGALVAARVFTSGITRRIQLLTADAARLEQGLPHAALPSGDDEIAQLGAAMEHASALLKDKNERLKLALKTAKIAIWEVDPSSDRIRYEGRDEFLESTGYPPDFLPDTRAALFQAICSEERTAFKQEFERSLASGLSFERDCQLVDAGGTARSVSITAQRYSHGRQPSIVLGVIADITERKRFEQIQLRQAEELAASERQLKEQTKVLQCVLDSMGDGVVVADKNGTFLLFNPAAERILGRGPTQGTPAEWSHQYGVFSQDQITPCPASELPLAQALQGVDVDGQDLFIRPENGSAGTWVSLTARPLKDRAGNIWGGVVVFRDITERKHGDEVLRAAKEEAETANRAKSEFLSRMSHELRTPLNSILGFAQLLEIDQLTADQKDSVVHVLKGGRHLLNLINEVLDIARVESGRLPLSSEPVRLEDALQEAVDLVRPIAASRKIRIFSRTTNWTRHVLADRQRLKQVLLNLLSNAVKYNREGGAVTVCCAESGPNRMRIAVTDTGHGINEENLAHLFVPFERLGADQSGVEGSGLGLAVSKRLVEAMGGSIGVQSTLGAGTTFWIELKDVEHAAVEELQDYHEVSQSQTAENAYSGKVLYIEDNLANIRLMERILAHRPNVQLMTALQGQLGLDLAREHNPDLIFLDLHLPDLRGDEVLRQLRKDPATCMTPVVMISADATPGQVERLIQAGAHGYITKPFDIKGLLLLLDETLGAVRSLC